MTNKLSHIFECSDHITEKQYRTSRALFILDGCASTQIFTVTSGAFLSGLAYLVGAGTALTGIIAALPTLMNTIQIFSSVVYENRAGSKRITVEFALIQRLCLLMMLFVPTLMLGARISVAVIAVLYSCAHFCGAFINTGANNWLISLVKKERLGRYLGLKDSMTLVASTGGSLILSKILDAYRFADQDLRHFMYRYLRGRHYLSHADPGTGKCETCGATEHKESNTDAAHRPELPQYIDFLPAVECGV